MDTYLKINGHVVSTDVRDFNVSHPVPHGSPYRKQGSIPDPDSTFIDLECYLCNAYLAQRPLHLHNGREYNVDIETGTQHLHCKCSLTQMTYSSITGLTTLELEIKDNLLTETLKGTDFTTALMEAKKLGAEP